MAASGGDVGLVEHQQLGHGERPDLGEHGVHGVDLPLRDRRAELSTTWTRKSAFGGHLERALERLDQPVRQAADEADGVGEQHRLATGQRQPPGGRVEGGEQPVLDEHAGLGEPVEQRRLAGVGVADDRDVGQAAACPALALQLRGCSDSSRRSPSSLVIRPLIRRRSTSSLVSPEPKPAADAAALLRQVGRWRRAAAAAAGSAAGPARPGPCPRGCARSGRRCRGSPRCGRAPCARAASPG